MRTAAAFFALVVSACAGSPAEEALRPGDPAEGARVAQDLCASCHAVGPTGDSPVAKAPAFRNVLSRYAADALAADLKRAASISHRNMPTFVMTDQHAEDLVAWLVSIQQADAAP